MHSKRLKPLHQVAQKKEDDAVKRYVDRQEQLRRQELRLSELEAYVAEYSRPPGQTVDMMQVRMRRDFVERLRGIVQMQVTVVQQARAACEVERSRWVIAHRSTEVLDKLAAKYRANEARIADRHAQRESDEIAVQLWRAQLPTA